MVLCVGIKGNPRVSFESTPLSLRAVGEQKTDHLIIKTKVTDCTIKRILMDLKILVPASVFGSILLKTLHLASKECNSFNFALGLCYASTVPIVITTVIKNENTVNRYFNWVSTQTICRNVLTNILGRLEEPHSVCDVCGGQGGILSATGYDDSPCPSCSMTGMRVVPSESEQRSAAERAREESEIPVDTNSRKCVVCYEPSSHVMDPCGHLCFCGDCSKRADRKCPMCRAPIKKFIKIF